MSSTTPASAAPKLGGHRRFIILTHARSGSSLLQMALAEHPQLQVFNEPFSWDWENRDLLPDRFSPRRFEDTDDGAAFLSRLLDAEYASGIRAVGMKLFFNHARRTASAARVWRMLEARADIYILRLIRRDLLASWVSYEVNERSGEWNISARSRRRPTEVAPFAIDPLDLLGFFEEVERYTVWADRTLGEHPTLRVYYEDGLCGDFGGTLARAHRFLGVSVRDVFPSYKRLAWAPPWHWVSNYSELSDWFAGTRFSAYVPPVTERVIRDWRVALRARPS